MNDKEETKLWHKICKDAGIGKKELVEEWDSCLATTVYSQTPTTHKRPELKMVKKLIPPPFNAINREKMLKVILSKFELCIGIDTNGRFVIAEDTGFEPSFEVFGKTYPESLLNLLLKIPEIYPELQKINWSW